jgi:hypothetical protein
MPDHFHLLVTLGTAVTLSAAVRLFKGPLTPHLRTRRLNWQGKTWFEPLTNSGVPFPEWLR